MKLMDVDTPTNRQAILAWVARRRAEGEWASAYAAAFMLKGVPYEGRLPYEYTKAVRELCRRMTDEGLLTFSAHGYLGVAGQPRGSF